MSRWLRNLPPARVALVLATGCAQTDLVATHVGDSCTGDACGPTGSCRPESCATLASRASLCAASAPPVHVGDSCSNELAPTLIRRFALCSCTDLVAPAQVLVDAYRTTLDNPAPGAAALAVNASLNVQQGRIDGSLHASTSSGSEQLELTGALVQEDAPCGCADEQLLDVSALVERARDDNDNAALPLDPAELAGFTGARELSLPCGRYFLSRLSGSDALTIRAEGNVALFVAGNVELDDALEIKAGPGGRVDVFVAGEMRISGALSLGGDPNGLERVSLFLAGTGSLNLRGSTSIVGDLYAPRADLVTAASFELYGSLFVRRAAPGGDLILHQDVAAAEPTRCESAR